MTLTDVNAMDREHFVQAFGSLAEDSPWVAERAFRDIPFVDTNAMRAAFERAIREADASEKLALLRAHPDLGTKARIGEASTAEQAGAGLQHLTRDEYERLFELNAEYKDKFGFPFLFAVKGSTKAQVLGALEERLPRSRSEEFRTAIEQVVRIVLFRLEATMSETSDQH